jgi:hypothetical protein
VATTAYTDAAVATAVAAQFPVVVHHEVNTLQNSVSGSYATVYTTTAAGLYRVSVTGYPSTPSSTAYEVVVDMQVTMNRQDVSEMSTTAQMCVITLGTTALGPATSGYNYMPLNLASGVNIGIQTAVKSGTNTGGVYTYAVTVERLA